MDVTNVLGQTLMWCSMQNGHITLVLITLLERIMCPIVIIHAVIAEDNKKQSKNKTIFFNNISSNDHTNTPNNGCNNIHCSIKRCNDKCDHNQINQKPC